MAETELAGQQLANIRQEKGLSQEDVAAELRLSVTYVKAIEADDYERLPEATFVRGYVRNYARYLGLPEAEIKAIVALYDQQNTHSDADYKGARPLSAYPAKRRSWWPLIFLLVLILIVIQGVMMWKKPYSPKDEQEVPKAETMSSMSYETEQQVKEVAANKNSAVVNLADEEVVEAQEATETPEIGEAYSEVELATEETDALLAEQAEEAELEETTVATETTTENQASSEALRISFNAACWVSVKNNNGAVLYTGTKQSGETLTLEESGPYHFVFGNGAAVEEMVVEGKVQELPARRSGQVWRPTISAN